MSCSVALQATERRYGTHAQEMRQWGFATQISGKENWASDSENITGNFSIG